MSALGVSNTLEILLVHADRWVRTQLGDQLHDAGHSVVEASNGAACLRYLARHRPDLMVIGPALSEISRADLVELLGINPDTRTIPIVTVTRLLEGFDSNQPSPSRRTFLPPPPTSSACR